MASDAASIVVLQTQRMGDLILTYPLLLWLGRRFPGHTVTLVAEPHFAVPLAAVSPPVAFVPLSRAETLRDRRHSLVLNLSIRPEVSRLAGVLRAETTLGPVTDAAGVTRVRGDWQLYRASLVGNNRHNRFHWAELNALDVIPRSALAATVWPEPRPGRPEGRRVGLFLGASQPEKRPDAAFFAALARCCLDLGLTPVLLGGPGEEGLGAAVTRLAGVPLADLCGRLPVRELALFGRELALLVTADTGPMHLAAWTGCPVLNLSLGPVNPLETGPYQPGHYVLQSRVSCRGCWRCERPTARCRRAFVPSRVALLVARLARGETADVALPGLALWRTDRDAYGFYRLTPRTTLPDVSARDLLGEFWKATFGWLFGAFDSAAPARAAAERLTEAAPRLAVALSRGLADLGAALARVIRAGTIPDVTFCGRFPPHVRPLAGFFERVLQNDDGSRAARRRCLFLLEQVASLPRDA